MSPEMREIESALLLTHQYIQSERKLLLRCIPTKLAFFFCLDYTTTQMIAIAVISF